MPELDRSKSELGNSEVMQAVLSALPGASIESERQPEQGVSYIVLNVALTSTYHQL